MSNHLITKNTVFRHLVLTGTSYEVGQSLGNHFKDQPKLLRHMSSPFMGAATFSLKQVNKVMKIYDLYCPGMNEEIRGFADSTGIPQEKVMFYYSYLPASGQCSQMVYLPPQKGGGSTIMGRSYEYSWGEEPVLCTTHVDGQASHIGFAAHLFGRYDGMNEHGLCVATSSGSMPYHIERDGLVFAGVVRAILNSCRSVDEGVQLLMSVPIGEARSYILADPNGQAALVETAGPNKGVHRIGVNDKAQYLCAANHFTLPDMVSYNSDIRSHSVDRYEVLHSRLRAMKASDVTGMKETLSSTFPEGVACRHYIEGFGTLWSMVFEPGRLQVEICFGNSPDNIWRKFNLEDKTPLKREYEVELMNEPGPSSFWSKTDPAPFAPLLEALRLEKNVIAVVLEGGVSPDEVWAETGVTLAVIVQDDKNYRKSYFLDTGELQVRLEIRSREEFKRSYETRLRSYDSGYPGVLLHTRDSYLDELFVKRYENRMLDRSSLLLKHSCKVLGLWKQARISLITERDITGSYLLLMSMIEPLAEIELLLHDDIPVRKTIQQAIQYNPGFFHKIVTDLIYMSNSEGTIEAALEAIDAYLTEGLFVIFNPVLCYLSEEQDVRTVTEMDDAICKRFNLTISMYPIYEWLAAKNVIYQSSTKTSLSFKTKVQLDETAFYYFGEDSHG